jgi:hypothetical protein
MISHLSTTRIAPGHASGSLTISICTFSSLGKDRTNWKVWETVDGGIMIRNGYPLLLPRYPFLMATRVSHQFRIGKFAHFMPMLTVTMHRMASDLQTAMKTFRDLPHQVPTRTGIIMVSIVSFVFRIVSRGVLSFSILHYLFRCRELLEQLTLSTCAHTS